ncbi:MAG: matrixin family metalloprotease, partial [Polyangiaceae bacterium]
MRAPGAVVFALGASLGIAACYDSRWGESKRAQQRLATKATPAEISPSTDPESLPLDGGRQAWRVRVRPDGRYLAQNLDVPRRVAKLLQDASRVLGPSIALDLTLDRIQPWNGDSDDDVGAALAALRGADAGDDVDLVVGMIGSLPRESDSLHDEGMATLLGKHVVVRGASRVGEVDSVQLTFGELSETDRAQLLERRRHHRALAVLLHEIAHCLGAIHETDVGSLMRPAYDPKMTGFGGGAIALMRAGLDGGDRSAVASAQLFLLEHAFNATWVPAERDAEVVRLRAIVGPAAAAAPV